MDEMKKEMAMKAVEILKKLGLPEEVLKTVSEAVGKGESETKVEVEIEKTSSEDVCPKCGCELGSPKEEPSRKPDLMKRVMGMKY